MNSSFNFDEDFSTEFQSIRAKITDLEAKLGKKIRPIQISENEVEKKNKENNGRENKQSIQNSEAFQKLLADYKILTHKNENLQKQNEILQRDKETSITSTEEAVKFLQKSLEEEKLVNKTLISKLISFKEDKTIPRLEAEVTVHKRTIIKVMKKLKKTQEEFAQVVEQLKEKEKLIQELQPKPEEKEEEEIKPIIAGDDDDVEDVELDTSKSDDEGNENENVANQEQDEIDTLNDIRAQIDALTKENEVLRQHGLEQMNGQIQAEVTPEISPNENQTLEEENKLLRQRLIALEGKAEKAAKQTQQQQLTPEQKKAIKDMVDELTTIRSLCSNLSLKVESLEKENNELSTIKAQLDEAIAAKDQLQKNFEELKKKPAPVVPKQIDIIPLFEQMELLQRENNELKQRLGLDDSKQKVKEDDELLNILENHTKQLSYESKEIKEMSNEIKKKDNEIDSLTQQLNDLTRKNQDLSIQVIALSDKTAEPDDVGVVVEDIEEDIPEPEKEKLDNFEDDFIDEDDDVEKSLINDASYWKDKYEAMKERVKKLEDQLELSFNPQKDGQRLLNDDNRVLMSPDKKKEGFSKLEGDDTGLVGSDDDDFENDFEDFGEEEDLIEQNKNEIVEKPDFNEEEHFEHLKQQVSESKSDQDQDKTFDDVKFESSSQNDENDNEENSEKSKEQEEKIKKLEAEIASLKERLHQDGENEVAVLKSKMAEMEAKIKEQEQTEQFLIKRCNDAQMFIEQQQFEMDDLREKKKALKKQLKGYEEGKTVSDAELIEENSSLAKEIQNVQQQIAAALKEHPK